MTDITNQIAAKYLGKRVSGDTNYNPEFLVAVPRCANREQYGILNENLPFLGYDTWHAYEFSTLTDNGVPVTRLLKLCYSCESEFIVESKSLKLYLNSFNMSKMGESIEKALENSLGIIRKDLSELLKIEVEASFIQNNSEKVFIFENFKNILDITDESKIQINKFNEAPELIKYENLSDKNSYYLHFDSLRSNCRVTHQPDFGDAFIYYKSKKYFSEESLVEYLTSFRSENHFHEECCEMIYKRLFDLLDKDDELFVAALYTRRGGIDICPSRWSVNCKIDDVQKLIDTTIFARNGVKQ